jgi:hypothetical protein
MVALKCLGGYEMAGRILRRSARWLGLARFLSDSCGRLTRHLIVPVTTILVAGGLLAGVPSTLTAARADTTCDNPIACENQKPGTPQSVWDPGSNDT